MCVCISVCVPFVNIVDENCYVTVHSCVLVCRVCAECVCRVTIKNNPSEWGKNTPQNESILTEKAKKKTLAPLNVCIQKGYFSLLCVQTICAYAFSIDLAQKWASESHTWIVTSWI